MDVLFATHQFDGLDDVLEVDFGVLEGEGDTLNEVPPDKESHLLD